MEDFKGIHLSRTSRHARQAYLDLGVDAVTMGGSEIFPALKVGLLMLWSGAARCQTAYLGYIRF